MNRLELIAIANTDINILQSMADIRKQLYEIGGITQTKYLEHLSHDMDTLQNFYNTLEVLCGEYDFNLPKTSQDTEKDS